MAAIDKTYLSYQDYLTLRNWCENTKLIYDNNKEGSPLDFLCLYDKPYEGEAPVWNTPEAFDRWLYFNCPLTFIQERLKIQYNNVDEYFSKPEPKLERGSHYIQITKPKYNFRESKYDWFIDIINRCIDGYYWMYGWDSNMWYPYYKLMPSEIRSSSCHVANLTKRKLNRFIKKWRLPIGTILRISNRYVGSEYKIKITK